MGAGIHPHYVSLCSERVRRPLRGHVLSRLLVLTAFVPHSAAILRKVVFTSDSVTVRMPRSQPAISGGCQIPVSIYDRPSSKWLRRGYYNHFYIATSCRLFPFGWQKNGIGWRMCAVFVLSAACCCQIEADAVV